jgi:cell division cycle protein 20 (cofactor of APC complex)
MNSPRRTGFSRNRQVMTPTRDSPNLPGTPHRPSPARFLKDSPNWKSPKGSPRSVKRRGVDLTSPRRSKSRCRNADRFITSNSQMASSQFQLSRKDSAAVASSSQTSQAIAHQEHTMTLNLTSMGLGFTLDSLGTPISARPGIPGSASSTHGRIDPAALAYQEGLHRAIGVTTDRGILTYDYTQDNLETCLTGRLSRNSTRTAILTNPVRRYIHTEPKRVLDVPGMVDDFYLNLMDWSLDNLLAVVLDRIIYIWNGDTSNVTEFATLQDDVTSVSFSANGQYLSIGMHCGDVQLWDVKGQRLLRTMKGHICRVGTLSWKDWIVSSGCRDGSIYNYDVRATNHRISSFIAHTGEVTGLSWRPGGDMMLASGGNDNLVNIWDVRNTDRPKWQKSEHKAAVRALSWCPLQTNLLATGGGAQDRRILFWNVNSGNSVGSIDTGSQVTRLHWSKEYKEILSTHGFPDNLVTLWTYPNLQKVIDFGGHSERVLHSAMSPDGVTVATAASDECLKFWTVWEKRAERTADVSNVFERTMRIR